MTFGNGMQPFERPAMHISLEAIISDYKEWQRKKAAMNDAIEQYTEERMNDKYGRIHTDGSRSGGQPALKPCPFCGGEAEYFKRTNAGAVADWCGASQHWVCCVGECNNQTCLHETPEQAIAAWNKRQPTQSDALRDQLLQECLVKLRDVQGTEAPKQYACNLIKRIERVLHEQSK